MAAYQRVEEKKVIEYERILEFDSKVAKIEVFIGTITPLHNLFFEKNDINIKDNKVNNWVDKLGEIE